MLEHLGKQESPAVMLIEECSALIRECCNVERFGLDDRNPPKKAYNRQNVLAGMVDVERRIKHMREWIKSIPVGSHRFVNYGDIAAEGS